VPAIRSNAVLERLKDARLGTAAIKMWIPFLTNSALSSSFRDLALRGAFEKSANTSHVKLFTLYGKAGILTRAWMLKDLPLNRVEALGILKPLFDLALTRPLPIPIIRELALLSTDTVPANQEAGPLKRGIHRRYLRLCRLQGDLGRLDLKKAKPGVSLEDFAFSKIDFLRYREIEEEYFDTLFSDGLADFDEAFFKGKFNLGRKGVQSLIETSYKKTEGFHKIQRENPMILSVMRTLETSLEDQPLFTLEEIVEELKKLPDFAAGGNFSHRLLNELYYTMVLSLDNVVIAHEDGMETKLVITAEGNLEGVFHPENKPWTRVLIPKNRQSVFSPPTNPGPG
jgi:hypothetical protein